MRVQLTSPEACADLAWATWTLKLGWAVPGANAALLSGTLRAAARLDFPPRAPSENTPISLLAAADSAGGLSLLHFPCLQASARARSKVPFLLLYSRYRS